MTDLEAFQKQHGKALVKALQNPALAAGMQLLFLRKIDSVSRLTDADIATHSREILGDLRGFFGYEHSLSTLHKQREFKLPIEPDLEYISPEQEAELQDLVGKFRKQNEPK